jgi:mRNA interferase MazF
MTTTTLSPGDVVTVDFPGVTGVKRRPAVIVSTTEHHLHRPDVILGIVTSQVASATTALDYVLRDWAAAGLRLPSDFRCVLPALPAGTITRIGQCSSVDWQEIQARLAPAVSIESSTDLTAEGSQ